MTISLTEAIKAVFSGKYLSEEAAHKLINIIGDPEASPIPTTVLLTLLAQREVSEAELIGFAKGMQDNITRPKHTISGPVMDTCGTGGDHLETFNVSTLSGLVVASAGVVVAKHGNRLITSKCGSADILEALGVNINIPPAAVEKCLAQIGFAFFFAPQYHPVMKVLGPIRKKMGIPTLFNSMGPLLNPLGVDYQIVGLYHSDTEKIAKVLQALGLKRGMVVHGNEGVDEISITTTTKVSEFSETGFNTYTLNPIELGLKTYSLAELQGGDVEKNLRLAREVLDPSKPINAAKSFVIINASAAIKIAKQVDFKSAIAEATEILQSGAAEQKLQELVTFTKNIADTDYK